VSNRPDVRDRLAQGVAANLLGRPAQLVFELAASVLVARFLGPELLATLVAIRALANVASSVGDFGITVSISKIVPDIAARHGRAEALRAAAQLTLLRLVAVPIVGLGTFLLARAGLLDIGEIELTWAMAGAALLLGGFSVVNGSRRYVILSALRLREIVVVDVLASSVGPVVNIGAAVLTRDPLTVALSSLATEGLVFVALHLWLSYDLDESGTPRAPITLAEVVRRYGSFAAMAYAKYVFNRVVLRNPMLLLMLGLLGASPAEVGNAAIALSLAFQAWEIANIPLGQMRAPLLARLHARNDRAGMENLEALSVAVVTVTSCALAVAAMAGAQPLVATVYGPAYADAARWTGVACAAGLLANVFSLGNTTLQQVENYRVQAVALAVAVAGLAAGLGVLVWTGSTLEPALVALLLIVLARTAFWAVTDLWADRRLFGWVYTGIKLRGILAGAVGLAAAALLAPASLFAGLVVAAACILGFLAIFRIVGGVGSGTRALLRSVLPAPLRKMAVLV
jgi:O-antigen/teichoic acid export membrane protein